MFKKIIEVSIIFVKKKIKKDFGAVYFISSNTDPIDKLTNCLYVPMYVV